MFEHPLHHPDMRLWEKTTTFSLAESTNALLRSNFECAMDAIIEGQAGMPFDDGEDHFAYYFAISSEEFVIKHLKQNARERLVLGYGISPDKVSEMKRLPSIAGVPIMNSGSMVEQMRAAHEVIASGIAEYDFLPTAIVSHQGEIFRIQRYIQRPEEHFDPMLGHLTMRFYETVSMAWPRVLSSPAFYGLPHEIQQYYRYFGLDNGLYTNAIFRGFIGTRPSFVIIDY